MILGLNVNRATFRTLDPELGRWWSVDPKAATLMSMNPYNSMANSPLVYNDPEGDFILGALTNGISGGINGEGFFNSLGQFFENRVRLVGGMFQTDESKNFWGRSWELISRFTWQEVQTGFGNAIAHTYNDFGAINEVNYFRGTTVIDSDFEGGAFTVGNVIAGPPGFRPDFTDHLFVHEYGHYLQSQRIGPLYLTNVALPSLTDITFWQDRHDVRWYEAGASRLAADYFDKEFGSGAAGYFNNSPNHFDREDFINGTRTPYLNPRTGGNRQGTNPINSEFHWSDILINTIYNSGLGLFGF